MTSPLRLPPGKSYPQNVRQRISQGDRIDAADFGGAVLTAQKDRTLSKREVEQMRNVYELPGRFTYLLGDKRPQKKLGALVRQAEKMTEARFELRSTVPGITFNMSPTVKVRGLEQGVKQPGAVDGWGAPLTAFERTLSVSARGARASKDGRVDFTFGKFHIRVDVKKGMPKADILQAISDQVERKGGGDGWSVHATGRNARGEASSSHVTIGFTDA